MERMRVRTDLALEARESFAGSDTEVHGVIVEEDYDESRDIRLTRVQIVSDPHLYPPPACFWLPLLRPGKTVLPAK